MKHKGFTIVELMVGLTIGILLLLIVMQSYLMYEGQKRTTTGGADSSENGLTALRALQSDIREGGAGFVSSQGIACPSYVNGSGSGNPLFPVQIIDGGGTANDTIIVNYGNTPAGGNMAMVLLPPTPTLITVQGSTTAFAANDIVLLSDPGSLTSCTMMQVASVTSFGATRIVTQAYPASTTYSFPSGATYGPQDGPIGGYVYDMGSMTSNEYQVLPGCNALVLSSGMPGSSAPSCTTSPLAFTNASAVADGIVALQAQYGVAPAGQQTVTCWVNATTGNTCDTADWSASGLLATPANIQRIKAIRVAVVARSSQMDKNIVSVDCAVSSNHGPCLWPDPSASSPAPTVDLSSDTNWGHYRYKVFTTIIPLKNVIWAQI
jgi:type IV pilus assembly protein PilW